MFTPAFISIINKQEDSSLKFKLNFTCNFSLVGQIQVEE